MAWGDADFGGASLDFLLDGVLDGVCGAQPTARWLGDREDCQTVLKICTPKHSQISSADLFL